MSSTKLTSLLKFGTIHLIVAPVIFGEKSRCSRIFKTSSFWIEIPRNLFKSSRSNEIILSLINLSILKIGFDATSPPASSRTSVTTLFKVSGIIFGFGPRS